MNEELVADLKQFIAATVSQGLADTNARIDTLDVSLNQKIDALDETVHRKIDALGMSLNNKIDGLSEAVAQALDESNGITDQTLRNHERRITKLEKRIA